MCNSLQGSLFYIVINFIKRLENLYVLAASQTRDKDPLTVEGVEKVLMQLKEEENV